MLSLEKEEQLHIGTYVVKYCHNYM